MNKFENMVKGLEKDIKVPEKVWENYVDTLNNLPDKPRVKHYTGRWAAAAAVFALSVAIDFIRRALFAFRAV